MVGLSTSRIALLHEHQVIPLNQIGYYWEHIYWRKELFCPGLVVALKLVRIEPIFALRRCIPVCWPCKTTSNRLQKRDEWGGVHTFTKIDPVYAFGLQLRLEGHGVLQHIKERGKGRKGPQVDTSSWGEIAMRSTIDQNRKWKSFNTLHDKWNPSCAKPHFKHDGF